MRVDAVLFQVLFVLGLGFLVANIKVIFDLVRFQLKKRSALLTWQIPKPRFYGLNLALGVIFGILIAVKWVFQQRTPMQLFGEAMMFVYYGYAFPLSTRIARGFYEDGVWSDSGFLPWASISAVSWKEETGMSTTLLLISHFRSIAKRLSVPGHLYGQARRVLRDKIDAHDIHMTGLDLDSRPDKDAI
jgi:hypothetical protein